MNIGNSSLPETVNDIRREIESLERRLRLLHRDFERDEPLPATLDILHCTTGDAHVGVPLVDIECVVSMAQLWPSPNAQPWIRGLLNLRGVLIPVVDLGMRVGRPPRTAELGDLIVICNLHRARVGLWIASVIGVPRIQTASIDRKVPELMGAPYLIGIATVNGHSTYLLRNDALLESVESIIKEE